MHAGVGVGVGIGIALTVIVSVAKPVIPSVVVAMTFSVYVPLPSSPKSN
ncbi:hypothetical protein [Archaeoglobus sp.]